MDLFEEMNNNQATGKKKNNNTLKIIIAIISVLVVAIIAIIGTILYLKSTTMKFYLDGQSQVINDGYIIKWRSLLIYVFRWGN